jgi:hypothetical protein
MRRDSFIALLMVCSLTTTQAQTETQALRFSMHNPYGTARYAAQGGAIGALGSDLSAAQVNPAGLGIYRSSELSFTQSFYWVNTSSDYLGNRADDSRFKYNVGSLGFVTATNSNRKSGFIGGSFSMGYNTLANFNNRTIIRGTNPGSTMLDDFTWHANSDPANLDPDQLDPFYEKVAYDAYLLPFDENTQEYWNDIAYGGYGQDQYRMVDQWGYIGEYSFAGAFNFSNILYMGANMGFQSVRFYEDIYHTESDPGNRIENFDSFNFREFNSTRGWGYNMRFGMIIRPFQMLRIGGAIQIPTFYQLTDQKVTDAYSTWDRDSEIPAGSAYSPNGIYDYKLRSPMKYFAHASVILFKMATLSAAYEYTDYASAELTAYDYYDSFSEENSSIRQNFQAVNNIKAGAEVRVDAVYFRGGFQYLMSPFSDSRNNAEAFIYSCGIGFRTRVLFMDASYSYGHNEQVYSLYSRAPGVNEVSVNQVNGNNIMVTMGLKF